MALTDSQGRNLPFFLDFYERHNIETKDFSPLEDPSIEDTVAEGYTQKGFIVRPHEDGDIFMISLHDFEKNKRSFTGLVPEPFYGTAHQWIECRVVKVFAKDDPLYPSATINHITVGVTV